MRLTRLHLSAPLAALLICTAALGGPISDSVGPRRWANTLIPEKLPPLKYPSYYKDLDKARAQAFAGRYRMALSTLSKVTTGDAAQIATVRATCLAATGRRAEAAKLLADPAVAKRASTQVLRARILGESGQLDEAIALLRKIVETSPKSLPARFYLGHFSEQNGDLITARDSYQWIFDNYLERWQTNGPDEFDNAEEVTLMGRAFDRWGTLCGGYQKLPGLEEIVLKTFTQAYDVIDTAYWPAHVAAAEYFLAHDSRSEAGKELKAAFKANPCDRDTLALACGMALMQWNFDAADAQIAAIRDHDPESWEADLLECRNLLRQRVPESAMEIAQRVLKQQPKNIEAMGLLAGCHALLVQDDQVKKILADVDKIDPANALAYYEVAEQLSDMRQYPRAAEMYKVAIERAPWWVAPRNGLGLLYTQSGDEDAAAEALTAAKTLDPFNRATHNYLILLADMKKMSRVETEHFVLSYDEKIDPIIPQYFPQYLESIYADVCGDFKHPLPVKTLIEVFPTHDAFSVRTTGSPWIGTVGASTGRVIALVSPRRGPKTMSTYNWAQVLRHEFTHTVTLSATDNRIAHWMTEGLAVNEEHSPVRFEWVPMLYQCVTENQLFPMDKLTWGFVRPKRPIDRQLAYAQSAWVCQYIEEKWGHDTILKMIEHFRSGKPEVAVFPEVLKVDVQKFTEDFFAWAGKQVEGWGYDEATTKKYNEGQKKAQKLIESRNYTEAVKAWEELCALRPVDALPHLRLAGLYEMDPVRNPDKVVEHLKRLHELSLKDNRYGKRLCRLYIERNDLAAAGKIGTETVYIDPYDIEAHEMLAEVCQKANDNAGLQREQLAIKLLEQRATQPSTPEPTDSGPADGGSY